MVEMTEAANILNNATRAEPGDPRRDRPRHEHLRRRVAGLGDHRVPARPGRLPGAVRHALPRAGPAGRDAAGPAQLQRAGAASGRTTSSSCTRSPRAAPTRATASTSPGWPACRAAVLERAEAVLAELENQHADAADGRRGRRGAHARRASPSCSPRATQTSSAKVPRALVDGARNGGIR